MNQFMTVNAFLLGLHAVDLRFNFLYSLVLGSEGRDNPWHANSLEWATPSPPPHYNFETIPTVYHAPYEYSVPGMTNDYLPQTQPRPPMLGRSIR